MQLNKKYTRLHVALIEATKPKKQQKGNNLVPLEKLKGQNQMKITFFKSIQSTVGYTADAEWSDICSHLFVRDNKDGLLYHPAAFRCDPPVRSAAQLESLNALIIDVDNDHDPDKPLLIDALRSPLSRFKLFWHSTHSNYLKKASASRSTAFSDNPDALGPPRYRVIIPFKHPVSPDDFGNIWDQVYALLGKNQNIDRSSRSAARAYYCPSAPAELREYAFHGEQDGVLLDLEPVEVVPEPVQLPKFESGDFELDDVKEALEFVNADCDRDTWIRVGMSLKDEYGDTGFSIWNEWSSKGQKYPGAKEMSKQWNSLTGKGTTLGSLMHFAMESGWVPSQEKIDVEDGVIIQGGNLWPFDADDPRSEKYVDEKTKRVTNAPGLVGRISDWINRSSRKPQPQLALAAAISAVGVIMGHRYRTETDLRSNMLVLGVAPSGAGKDHARKCIDNLFRAAGCEYLIGGGNVSSSTAILSSMAKTGRKLFMMDEIGIKLKAFTATNAASHQTDVLATAMEMFSSANMYYRGMEYADQKNRPRIDIDEPCMCLYGTTVPDRFYEAISGKEASDGFLPRFLVFTSKVRNPKRNNAPESNQPPIMIVEEVKSILNDKSGGNLGTVATREIPFTQRARELFHEFSDLCDEKGEEEYEKASGLDAIWSRACEHAYKLSLLCKEGDEIDANVAGWCINLIKQQIDEILFELGDNLASSLVEVESNKILRLIKQKQGWCTLTEISKACRHLTPRQRDDYIRILLNAELIAENKDASGKGRPKIKYISTELLGRA